MFKEVQEILCCQKYKIEQKEEENGVINMGFYNDEQYVIPEAHKVANFDMERAQQAMKKRDAFSDKTKYIFSKKFLKTNVFGACLKPIGIFIVFYYFVFIVYLYGLPNNKICQEWINNKTQSRHDYLNHPNCNFDKNGFCENVNEWKEQHSQLTKIITFLLGFYVSTIMRRWWDQLVNLPDIVDTALALNGLVIIPNGRTRSEADSFKKRILRYLLLSWTMLMTHINKSIKSDVFDGEELVKKGLATKEEMRILKKFKLYGIADNSMMIPLNWCVNMLRDEINHSKPLIPKEGKVIIQEILKFKKNLHRIHQHHSNNLPQICKQAVQCSVWFFLFFGALALQPCTNEGYKQLFTVLPMCNIMIYVLIFTWLKMASLCKSPFDKDDGVDYDLKLELDLQIWNASIILTNNSYVYMKRSFSCKPTNKSFDEEEDQD